MAGRYWYLEEAKTPEMQAACREFEHSCGKDPLQILLALKYRGEIEPIRETYAGQVLLSLHARARAKHPYSLDFLDRRGEKKAQPVPTRGRADTLLIVGCFVGFVMILALSVIGLVTLFTWF